MKQLSLLDILASTPTPLQKGTYFVLGQDAFKRTADGWLKLDVVLGPPIFGYRNLKTGWQLMQPDYVGSHWVSIPAENLTAIEAAHASGEMVAVDVFLGIKMKGYDWGWRKAKRRADDGTVSVGRNPGGGEIRLKKVPGRKAKWIYTVDIYSADGQLFSSRKLGLWCGMMFLGNVRTAEHLVEMTFGENIIDLQTKIADADSGKDFGFDRSWETTSPETLAKKLIFSKKQLRPKPLEPEEYRRLLELNGGLNRNGRFSEDRSLNLGLDHLYAELIIRLLAWGFVPEDVWGNGPRTWEKRSRDGVAWFKGHYMVIPSRRAGSWIVTYGKHLDGLPHIRGVFKTPEKAMQAADLQVFERTFEERNYDGVKEDFGPIKREIYKAGLKVYLKAQVDDVRSAA